MMMKKGGSAFHRKYSLEEMGISPERLLRVAGPGADGEPGTKGGEIDGVLKLAERCCTIEGGYVIYTDPQFDPAAMTVQLGGVTLRPGQTVFQQLIRARRIAVFACTPGREVGKYYKDAMQGGDFQRASLIEVLATIIAECTIDRIQEHLLQELSDRQLRITSRFSPGFCHWDIEDQRMLYSLLPPGFSGITVDHRNVIDPCHSILGIIGIGRNVRRFEDNCEYCTTLRCLIRREQEG